MQEFKLVYIDPGTGSFIVQALVATAAGLAVVARRYWTQIRAFLGRPAAPSEDEDASPRQ